MPTLYLGVIEQQYPTGESTSDVAQILEKEYGLMETFFRLHRKEIIEALTQGMVDALKDQRAGKQALRSVYLEPTADIEQMFRQWLNQRGPEKAAIPGTPTKAALKGVNHRLKHPYGTGNSKIGARPNKVRPSFIDTGLFQRSFRAWIK